MRAYVRDIFSEAVEQDFLVKDPARKVTVPSQLRDTDKTTLINVGTATECAFASVVLRPSGIENVRIRDRLQRRYSALGQNKEEFGTRARAEGTGGRSVAVEAGVSGLVA